MYCVVVLYCVLCVVYTCIVYCILYIERLSVVNSDIAYGVNQQLKSNL